MINKAGIIKSAQKFVAKGQIDKAILEYEKLLKERKDGNIYNTIGDLNLKYGDEQKAMGSFTKAAEIFRKDGFYPKAIAIYKKVLNIAPNDVDTLIALAKLNANRGLTGNAIEHYYRAAEIYNRDGSTENAVNVVEKMLTLEPTDISTRAKIAYLYFRIGMRERAANEYASIALNYLEQENDDGAQEFFDKAVEYDPENISALIGLSTLSEKRGNTDEAFQFLEKALSNDDENKEALLRHSQLAINLQRNDEAKKTLLKIMEIDPSDAQAKKLLGDIYIDEGKMDKAWDELLPGIDEALNEEKWDEGQELLQKFKEAFPIPARERLLRISRAQGDSNAIASDLQELASLHEKEGSDNDALQLYREARDLNPDDIASADKVKALEIKLGMHQPEAAVPENPPLNESIEASPGQDGENSPGMKINLEDHISFDDITSPDMDSEGDLSSPSETTGPLAELEPTILPSGDNGNRTYVSENLSDDELAARKAEADFYLQQGLENEAVEIYEALLAARPDNEVISRKLASLKPAAIPAAPQKEDISTDKEKEDSLNGGTVDDDLQALFSQFESTEDKTVDYESHYVAGLDFKQKGLLNEAVKELEIAAKDPDKKQRNATMLALCYMGTGSYPLAIATFNEVVGSMSPSESTYLHVKYELANAHMQNNDVSRALALFTEVHAQDPDFKDVSAHMDSLKAKQAPADKPKSKRDRVSYI